VKDCSVSDSFDLQRFVDAQAPVYQQVVAELSRGRKRGCGSSFRRSPVSASARWRNASQSARSEAVAYLKHDLLGLRLLECARFVLAASEKTITDILGSPDDMKCMTLFDAVSKQEIIAEAIAAFYPDGM
jgi:uncharacterized protein (DUF1810 family)